MTSAGTERYATRGKANETKGPATIDSAAVMQRYDERPRRAKLVTAAAAGIVIVLLGGGALFWQSGDVPFTVDPGMAVSSAERHLTIQPQAIFAKLDITGTIAAGRFIAIVAPFDGVIREKRVTLGDHVKIGDVLVVMDTSEIASRYRDAQSAYLKAAMASAALDKWESSTEVLRARRALEAAEASLATLERQVVELKALLDRGIVSRNEYEGLVQQRDTQLNTVAGARDDLATTLERGGDEKRQLVKLELENAKSRLDDLKQQMAGATVTTEVAGILTRPPVSRNGQGAISIEPGVSVTRGTALFTISDTSSFVVTGRVDEVDVNKVKIGQSVTITSEAFPDRSAIGRVVNVSAEADEGGGFGRAPTFEMRASFSVEGDELRQLIRLGMSVRMTIEIYSNAAALIVPPSAILDAETGLQIRIRRDGKALTVPVVVGATFPAGVEVMSGLSAGDIVIVSDPI